MYLEIKKGVIMKLNHSLRFLWIIMLFVLVSIPVFAHWYGGAHCSGKTCSKEYNQHTNYLTDIDMQIIYENNGGNVINDPEMSISETQPSMDVGNFGFKDKCSTEWASTAYKHGDHCHVTNCHHYEETRGGKRWAALHHIHNMDITTDGFSLTITHTEYTAVIMKHMLPFDFCGADEVSDS